MAVRSEDSRISDCSGKYTVVPSESWEVTAVKTSKHGLFRNQTLAYILCIWLSLLFIIIIPLKTEDWTSASGSRNKK